MEAIAIVDHLPYYLYRAEARTILGAIYVYQGRLQGARQVARAQPTAWDEQSPLWLEAELARAEGR